TRHRPGSPRPTADADEALLRLPEQIRAAAQLGDLPGMSRTSRRVTGHEPRRVRTRPQGGNGTELSDRRLYQVGPQELLLPGPAEELSDQPVRSAVQRGRLPRNRHRRRAEKSLAH